MEAVWANFIIFCSIEVFFLAKGKRFENTIRPPFFQLERNGKVLVNIFNLCFEPGFALETVIKTTKGENLKVVCFIYLVLLVVFVNLLPKLVSKVELVIYYLKLTIQSFLPLDIH